MIAGKVPTEQELFDALREKGFEQTPIKTATGTMWRNKKNRRVLQVPNSYDGHYPKWMCEELIKRVGDLDLWAWGPKNH